MSKTSQRAVLAVHDVTESTKGKQFGRMSWATEQASLAQQPGGRLLVWLFHEANVREHTLIEMATALNVTHGYLSQLRSGMRQVRHITDTFAESCANYLCCPVILVKLASGCIKATDFLMPEDRTAAGLEVALRKVQSDPVLGALLPADAFTATRDIQRFIVMCYQEASGQEVYPYRALPDMLRHLHQAAAVFDGLDSALEEEKESTKFS